MPHILITNDDGVQSPGILALAQALRPHARVSILAPHRNWSISGHNKTMHKPLRVWSVALADGSEALTTDGGPSDCVVLATQGLLSEPVDLVISGINNRPNLGNDITYSGTVAAAMEATIAGFPALALSIVEGEPRHWVTAAQVASHLAQKVLQNGGLPHETLLNVNVPNLPMPQLKGWQMTRLGPRRYHDEVVVRQDPDGKPYYWIAGEEPVSILEPETDGRALAHGYVSITPLQLDMTHHQILDSLSSSLLGT